MKLFFANMCLLLSMLFAMAAGGEVENFILQVFVSFSLAGIALVFFVYANFLFIQIQNEAKE